MTLLRTPDEAFAHLPGWPYAARYAQPLGEAGPRLAYIDEGPRDAPATVLCLHGNPSWGYLYRHMLPEFLGAGLRVVVPDLIGFGRSDKPADEAWHRFDTHRQSLLNFIELLDLRKLMLVCQDWGGIFGLTLPMVMPERFTRALVMNTTLATGELTEGFKAWRTYSNSQPDLAVGRMLRRGKPDMSAEEAAGYDAPFPDARYKAALRAFPNLVPDGADAPGAATSREALAFWQQRWTGDSFMAVGQQDPVLAGAPMDALRAAIRGCPPPMVVAEGGHFVPEWGAPIARAALAHFGLSR
ncbi:MAG: haloalkane dehalogenase [Burkholderiales bacterium RIFCSPHIGHO2_12_FULL_69_20]|nr:MAG: haloalkane dehalogenase [Burkholderiales bacterium RIFCSPHIGHO2_12_FULL_69_20]